MLSPYSLCPTVPSRCLFLDRDGTLIKECHYLRDPALVALENGVVEGLRFFHNSGYRLVVVSNQSGISRSLISISELEAVNLRIAELLENERIIISSWHHCPHLPDRGCLCRKPATGLFLAADAIHPVDWPNSIMVGDKPSDIQAGLALGLFTALVTTGYGTSHVEWAQQSRVPVINSLLDLVSLLNVSHDS